MPRLNRNEQSARANANAVAVTSVPQLVVSSNSQRVSLQLRNNGSSTVYLGPTSSVTTGTGYPLGGGEEYVFEDYVGAVYVVTATTGDLRFWDNV